MYQKCIAIRIHVQIHLSDTIMYTLAEINVSNNLPGCVGLQVPYAYDMRHFRAVQVMT